MLYLIARIHIKGHVIYMITKKVYALSIKEVIKIIIIYYIIAAGIIGLPLDIVIHAVKFGKNSLVKEIIFCANQAIYEFGAALLILNYVRKKGAEKLKFHGNLNIKLLLATIFIFLSYSIVCSNSLDLLISKIPVDDSLTEAFNLMSENIYLNLISAAIIAPIAEEIIMRGVILEGLLQKYRPWVAIVVSSLVFGIIHMNLPQFISATLGGIILGIVYFKTRSLILTIVGHACNNIIASIDIPINIVTLAIGLIVLAIAVLTFKKNTNIMLKIGKGNSLQL